MKSQNIIKSVVSASVLTATLTFTTFTSQVQAHCEIPCGIYSDDTVFIDLTTHLATIEKAMTQITELSKDASANANQISRWVTNKESHATKIQEIVAQYFLTQRIKTGEADTNKEAYITKLTQLHHMTVLAMKCKQTTDVKNAKALGKTIEEFKASYNKK